LPWKRFGREQRAGGGEQSRKEKAESMELRVEMLLNHGSVTKIIN
jgi:hypothetical protein